jgi:ubiquinone/menaquinone biosynthesis C-methylase UbiE
MKQHADSTVDPFNKDVAANSGYLYTTSSGLSSQLANRRLSDAALAAANFRDQRVIDIGCGDGTYTMELFDRGQPASMHGVDPACNAIDAARKRAAGRNIRFAVENAYKLPFAPNSFDLAHLRGVLHHMDRPADALREAFRVAPLILVIEPNGYNPILKLLEKASRYHREHEEKSYPALRLDKWVRDIGGSVILRKWVGLVPFFCPDAIARLLKQVEPFLEKTPLIRACGCAVYVMVAKRRDGAFPHEP